MSITLSDLEAAQPVLCQHSVRFRRVATCYPHRVAVAYDGDITAAALDSDDEVAAVVAEWERAHGMVPVDWVAVGVREHEGD